jgi:hypothetical protein
MNALSVDPVLRVVLKQLECVNFFPIALWPMKPSFKSDS